MPLQENDLIAIFASSAVAIILVLFFLYIVINNYRKNSQRHLESIRLIFETQEAERDRIARDLHDGIGGLLSAAKMHLEIINLNKNKEETMEAAKSIGQIIDRSVTDLRYIVRNMIPRNLAEKGWIYELYQLSALINKGKGRDLVEMHCDQESIKLKPEAEISLYRIVQELINNSIKHAHASLIEIKISKSKEILEIVVCDNGTGLNPDSIVRGHGHKNIQSRVDTFHGSVKVDYANKKGTRFIIRFELSTLA